jgi:hypothetical protein
VLFRGVEAGTPDSISSSSLESLETTEPVPGQVLHCRRYGTGEFDSYAPASKLEQSFRHSCWAGERKRVWESLQRIGSSARRLDAFANCGNTLWLRTDGQDLVLTCNTCHDRACLPCQRARQRALVEAIMVRMLEVKQPVRFMTFTLRTNCLDLRKQIRRLLDCLHLLRRKKWWRDHAAGGANFVEVKLGRGSRAWHVHCHCLVEGKYVDQKELSRQWLAVTGDSSIVDVRKIDAVEQRAKYVAKYATKPASADVICSPAHLDEFLLAIKGARLYQAWGTWAALGVDDPQPSAKRLTHVGSIEQLVSDAIAGDTTAQHWLEAAARKWPMLRELIPLAALDPTARPPPIPP